MTAARGLGYGSGGRIGVGVPQANPTVEAELAILLPRNCTLHVTRLVSGAASSTERLREYLLRLDHYLRGFDVLRPAVFGFACTGSSYLLGAQEEARIVAAAESAFGYPIETAARAILWALQRIGALRIAVIAPYPPSLLDAARDYWRAAGIEIVREARIATRVADTRAIYELDGGLLDAELSTLSLDGIQAVLVSGTGLPSLPSLRRADIGVPILSSNFCLAARLLDRLGRADALDAGTLALRGWRERFDEAMAAR